MTKLDLQPIKEREAAASPVPWTWTPWDGVCGCKEWESDVHESPDLCPNWYWYDAGELDGPAYIEHDEGDYQWFNNADLAFVAHARQDVPALISEVEHQRQRAEEAEADAYVYRVLLLTAALTATNVWYFGNGLELPKISILTQEVGGYFDLITRCARDAGTLGDADLDAIIRVQAALTALATLVAPKGPVQP